MRLSKLYDDRARRDSAEVSFGSDALGWQERVDLPDGAEWLDSVLSDLMDEGDAP